MRFIVPIVLCLVFLSAGSAEAQLCAGAPSFRDNRFQAGVTAALNFSEVLVPFSAGNGDAIFSIQFLFNFGQ